MCLSDTRMNSLLPDTCFKQFTLTSKKCKQNVALSTLLLHTKPQHLYCGKQSSSWRLGLNYLTVMEVYRRHFVQNLFLKLYVLSVIEWIVAVVQCWGASIHLNARLVQDLSEIHKLWRKRVKSVSFTLLKTPTIAWLSKETNAARNRVVMLYKNVPAETNWVMITRQILISCL